MITRRRTRIVIALLAIASLILAACGSRIDSDTIAHAAAGTGGTGGSAAGLPGADDAAGLPGADDAAGAGPAEAATAGKAGGTGTGPGKGGAGQEGKSRQPGGPGGPGGSGDSGKPIVIGSVGTYSGPIGAAFAPSARAVQAWAAAINSKGGLNGRPVKVIVMDDGGSAATSRAKVRELVETHKVVAIVSANVLAAPIRAWKDYVEKKKVPVFGAACGQEFNAVLFNECPALDKWAFGTMVVGAKYATGKKFGAMLCREDPNCDQLENLWFAKGYAKRAGLEPVYRAKISLTQPDFTSECIQAKNAGVQVLTVIADANGVARVAASCRRQNYRPQFLQLGASMDAKSPTKPGLDNVLQTSFVFPFAGLSTPEFREFDEAWKKYGGGQPASSGAAHGWASAKMFEYAAGKASKSVTRDKLIEVMYTLKNERFGGVTIPKSFSTQGTKDSSCVFAMKAVGGRWTTPKGDKPTCW